MMELLPFDIKCEIATYLGFPNITVLAQLNKGWREWYAEPTLWKKLFKDIYGEDVGGENLKVKFINYSLEYQLEQMIDLCYQQHGNYTHIFRDLKEILVFDSDHDEPHGFFITDDFDLEDSDEEFVLNTSHIISEKAIHIFIHIPVELGDEYYLERLTGPVQLRDLLMLVHTDENYNYFINTINVYALGSTIVYIPHFSMWLKEKNSKHYNSPNSKEQNCHTWVDAVLYGKEKYNYLDLQLR